MGIRKHCIGILLLSTAGVALGEDMASCSEPKGYGYYPRIGAVSKAKSGWSPDAITGGRFKLTRASNGQYDIVYYDATKQVYSTAGDGALVRMLRHDDKEMTILVVHPAGTLEIYTFAVDDNGKGYVVMHNNRPRDAGVAKASLMVGACSSINFIRD